MPLLAFRAASEESLYSIEAEDFADLAGYFIDFFGLILFHVNDLFALGELVGLSSRHVR